MAFEKLEKGDQPFLIWAHAARQIDGAPHLSLWASSSQQFGRIRIAWVRWRPDRPEESWWSTQTKTCGQIGALIADKTRKGYRAIADGRVSYTASAMIEVWDRLIGKCKGVGAVEGVADMLHAIQADARQRSVTLPYVEDALRRLCTADAARPASMHAWTQAVEPYAVCAW